MDFNHGDKIRTTDGSGNGTILCHIGKNSYGEHLFLVKWKEGTEGQISERYLQKI